MVSVRSPHNQGFLFLPEPPAGPKRVKKAFQRERKRELRPWRGRTGRGREPHGSEAAASTVFFLHSRARARHVRQLMRLFALIAGPGGCRRS